MMSLPFLGLPWNMPEDELGTNYRKGVQCMLNTDITKTKFLNLYADSLNHSTETFMMEK
jgi:hypothetical protein